MTKTIAKVGKPSKKYEFTSIEVQFHSKGIYVRWSCNIGFGGTAFIFNKKDGLTIKTEAMGIEFIKVLVAEISKRMKKKTLPIALIGSGNIADIPFCNDELIINLLETFVAKGKIVE